MKKIKIFPLIIIICLVLSCGAPMALALDEPQLQAKAAVIIDLDSGRVLYSKNMDEQRAPASLTKVMTVLLVLEAIERGELGMEEMVTAQADCRIGMDESSSTSNIQPGTEVSVRELLYCAMLQSANEACNIMATRVSGSISAFVEKMNERAAELGCANTHFMNTNGLTAEGHYSSAYDMSVITRAAQQHPDFMDICNTLEYQPQSQGVNGGEKMYNSNALINGQSVYGSGYLYEYASGGKTGFTQAAGYCLISTAEKEGVRTLAVVLGCNGMLNTGDEDYGNFVDSRKLYNWAFDNFSYRTVISSADPIERVAVEMSSSDEKTVLRPQGEVSLLLPNDLESSNVTTDVTIYEEKLIAPIAAGTVLGEARVLIDGVEYGRINLINSVDVELARGEYFKVKLSEIFSKGWVVAIIVIVLLLLVGYLVLVIRYRRLRKKHLKARRLAEERRRLERQGQPQRQYYDEADYRGRH